MAHLLFLSHAGADTERALRLAAAIEASPEAQKHGLKVWLDKRPDGPHRLQAGMPWQDQLERAIAKESSAFGLLLTREGARNWVRLEVRVALDRVIAEQRAGAVYPFVPIIADDPGDLAHLPPFAQQYQGVRLTDDGQGLADLVRTAARLDAAQPVRLVAQPFMGLEAFEAKDAALFFGRRKETQDLVDRLRTTNLILVTGDSGSGKSSLVKAGLIPAFREGALADPLGRRPEPGQWHVVEMRPGTDPFEGLVEGVGKAASAAGKSLADQGTLNDWVRTRDPDKIRDALRQSGPPGASLLLVVDQFEELWTLTLDDPKRRAFLAALLALVPEGDLARRVVGTMRRDYYHLHTDDERLCDRLTANGNAGRFLLGAMTPESLRAIVEKPLLLAGESETRAATLADEVVKDVAGEPGNLALVEMALHESWERRHESGGDLALAYQRLDRLEGALARAAEEVFWNPTNDPNKLTEPERPIAEALFMRLVRAGDISSATRRPVAFAEVEDSARTVARKLATPECRRLLVLREPDRADIPEHAITVEIAHEQLVTQWPDYQYWLRGSAADPKKADSTRAADKRAFDRLMDAAANWNGRGREDEDLARGGELAEFKWLRTASFRNPWLSPLEREFVDQSLAAGEAAENKRQQQVETLRQLARTRRRQTWGAVIAAVLLLVIAGIATWQWRAAISARNDATNQQKKAEENARTAEAAKSDARTQQLAAEANAQRADAQLAEAMRIDSRRLANLSLQATRSGDAVTGILLALRALPDSLDKPNRPIVFEVWSPLRQALAEQRELHYLRGHEAPVSSAAFSPDGTRIVTASDDNTARIWRADGTGEPIVLRAHGAPVFSATFSPDGTCIITASADNTARIWHADGTGEPIVLRGHKSLVRSAAFSSDGVRVVTASADNTARVWRADGTGEPIVLRGHEGSIFSAAFSSDGTHIVTASADNTARVWRADGTGEPVILRGHENAVTSAAFSPGGSRVVTASRDRTARVWQLDNTGEPIVLRGHESPVLSAIFSPDGTSVVTTSDDNTARVWLADGTGEPIVLRGHENTVTSAAFSPDGMLVVTASRDRTARVWRADGAGEPIVLRGHESLVRSATFSPNGAQIVTASADNSVRVWRANGTGQVMVLRGHQGWIFSAEFSLDGTHIVTASQDNTARVWRADGNGEPIVLRGHAGLVLSAKFSPDGARVLSASKDGTARIWRVDGTGDPIILRGDGGPVFYATFSADGTRVLTTSKDGKAKVWRADGTGSPIILRRQEGLFYPAAFSPDGTRVLTASSDGTARIWRVDGAGDPIVLRGHGGSVFSAAFSPDGMLVVTASGDRTARVWHANGTGEPLILRGHESLVFSAVFSPDGTRIVTASKDGTARVWHADGTGDPIVLRGHGGPVISATFSPDGARIATASDDNTVRVWRAESLGDPIVLLGHENSVTSALFSPNGTSVISASNDGTTRLWPLIGTLEQLAAYARSLKLPRQLTDTQKKQYFIVDDW